MLSRSVRLMDCHDERDPGSARLKPVSGMKAIMKTASAMNSTPPTITGSASLMLPSTTLRMIPAMPPICPACEPRRKTLPMRSSPTSSTIHASCAPLMKVTPMPQMT